jgi:RNA polymerase sigma-54 factor
MSQGMQLSQRLALQQVLAPQLQQSLALLQAPILELKALVEQELQQNPVLEEVPENEAAQIDVKSDPATEQSNTPVDDFHAEFDRLAQVDQDWRDYYSQANTPLRTSEEEDERRQFMFDSLAAGTSLQEHLLEQVRLSEIPPERRPVAEMIVGNIDERGYLQAGVEELAFATNFPPGQVGEVLTVIQRFDPPGVGARDLRECLRLQLERVNRRDSLEYRIVSDHIDQLARHRFPEIARALDCSVAEVQEAAHRISHLEPRPGRDYEADSNHYVYPEIFIRKVGRPLTFSEDDLRDLPSLANKLKTPPKKSKTPRRSVDEWLAGAMSAPTQAALKNYEGPSSDEAALKSALVKDLNRAIRGSFIFDTQRFAGVALRAETQDLLAKNPQGDGLLRLNRMLFEDAYPLELAKNPAGDDYTVTTNNEGIPHLRISNTYKDLMAQPNSAPEVQDYIREKIRAGKFLIKSMQQRQETLLKIAREIIQRQRDFLEHGPSHLRPMTMAQIAQVVGVHETTISRAVSGKYVETPQGVFELRYFFTSGIPTTDGGGMSNESVKQLLAELVAGEDRLKPLSDEDIVRQFNMRGIMIARRTVAKYRSELNILPSHLRRIY